MSLIPNEYRDLVLRLHELGILQVFKSCDDKKLTGKLVLEIEYNQGGMRSIIRETERVKIK